MAEAKLTPPTVSDPVSAPLRCTWIIGQDSKSPISQQGGEPVVETIAHF